LDENPIVVIGAGTTGASTAYHLARAGKRVVLIDGSQVGGGTTSLSSAIVRTHYSNVGVARMALYSLRVFRDFGSIGQSGLVRSGLLILAPSNLRQGILSNVKMLNSIGATNEILDASEAVKLFPELDLVDADLIVYEPESGYADSVGIANAYAGAARTMGAVVLVGRKVTQLVTDSGSLSSIALSDGSRINCSRAILCTNVWTNKLLARSGVILDDSTFPLWAAAHPVIVLRRPNDYQGVRPIILDATQKTYYKPEGQYLLSAGSLDPQIDAERVDPDSYPADVSFEFLNLFSEALARRIPIMSKATLHSSHVGLYDMTPDQHPIMDELSSLGLGGVYCCVGLSGHGFKLCPALGLMNAEMLLETQLSEQRFDRSIFALSRFARGALIETKYPGLATVA
jgi:glycine/D-amino acid oxidase-like deaminating enzyme